MALKAVPNDYTGGPRQPEKSPEQSRREMLIGTAAAVGGMGAEAAFGPVRRLYKLLTGDDRQDAFPDRKVPDELEARRRQDDFSYSRALDELEARRKTDISKSRLDTKDKALNSGTTDPARPTISEETFQERRARMEREHEARLEAGINEHINPKKIAELEKRLEAVPKYLETLQLRFKPDGKLEPADEAQIRAFLAETLKCKPEELKFEQYEAEETQGFQRSVYITLKEELIASIDGDIEFALIKHDLTGLRALRIEIDTEGRINRYHHKLIHNGKEETYDFSGSFGHTHYTITDVKGRDANSLLEEIILSCDSTGKAKSASRQTSEYGTNYEYYYRDRAAFDAVHKK